MKKRLLTFAKFGWIALVLGAVVWYVVRNFSDVIGQLSTIPPLNLLACLALVVLGRLCLAQISREMLVMLGKTPSYGEVLYMAGVSEPAKYIPGGVWHFVGRGRYYAGLGLSLKDVTRVLLIENLWLVGSGAFVGLIGIVSLTASPAQAWVFPFLLVAWLAVVYLAKRALAGRVTLAAVVVSVGIQALMWALWGVSFAALLPVFPDASMLVYVIGAFTISWVAGLVAVFAPGGIGVREAFMVGLLLPLVAPEVSFLLATFHRLIWIGAEVLIALGVSAFEKRLNPQDD